MRRLRRATAAVATTAVVAGGFVLASAAPALAATCSAHQYPGWGGGVYASCVGGGSWRVIISCGDTPNHAIEKKWTPWTPADGSSRSIYCDDSFAPYYIGGSAQFQFQ